MIKVENKSDLFFESAKELRFVDFEKNEKLGLGIPVVVVVKGQDQQMRAQRLLQTFTSDQKFQGRSTMRQFSDGFCFLTRLTQSLCSPDKNIWFKEFLEPRHISFTGDSIIVTAADAVHIFNTKINKENVIYNQFFGSLHTAIPNEKGTKFLVASTGFDSILELDMLTNQEDWRWTAWDHGYNITPSGIRITTNEEDARIRQSEKEAVILINDLKQYGNFGLPTAYRTTHVNEAIYDYDENYILATFFHQGIIVRINKQTGETKTVMSGMKNPHGIKKYKDGYIVTDTKCGLWYQLDKNFNIIIKVNFKEFPNKSGEMKDLEWIQYVAPLTDDIFIAIDANRYAGWVFDLEKRQYNKIDINPNWSIQTILPVAENYIQPTSLW